MFVAIVAALYLLVFFTGNRSPTPKLGIDLQGGTRVTLTARTPNGAHPAPRASRWLAPSSRTGSTASAFPAPRWSSAARTW